MRDDTVLDQNPDLEVPECGAVVLHHAQAEGILAPH
jgi:hypothetical protein